MAQLVYLRKSFKYKFLRMLKSSDINIDISVISDIRENKQIFF